MEKGKIQFENESDAFLEPDGDLMRKISHREFEERFLGGDTRKIKDISLRTTGIGNPFALINCVEILIICTDILLHRKNYDGHGHEEMLYAMQAAQEYVKEYYEGKPPVACENCEKLERENRDLLKAFSTIDVLMTDSTMLDKEIAQNIWKELLEKAKENK